MTTVLFPTKFNWIRGALSSCAIEGNTFARELLDTIRRIDSDEPVSRHRLTQLDDFMREYA